MNYKVHKTAVIDDGAIIGSGSKIWHWVHISSGAKIGNDVILGQNVYVGSKAIIGNNCKIQNNVSIYDNVNLDDGVFCGPSVVFTNVYNPRSHIDRKSQFQNTFIRKGVSLGANSTIICGIEIGEFAFIGAGAVVNKNVPSFALMVGVPAKQIGWISEYGVRLDLPIRGYSEAICEYSGSKYLLKDNIVTIQK